MTHLFKVPSRSTCNHIVNLWKYIWRLQNWIQHATMRKWSCQKRFAKQFSKYSWSIVTTTCVNFFSTFLRTFWTDLNGSHKHGRFKSWQLERYHASKKNPTHFYGYPRHRNIPNNISSFNKEKRELFSSNIWCLICSKSLPRLKQNVLTILEWWAAHLRPYLVCHWRLSNKTFRCFWKHSPFFVYFLFVLWQQASRIFARVEGFDPFEPVLLS